MTNRGRGPRSYYSDVRPGTKREKMLQLMMRPGGVTIHELTSRKLTTPGGGLKCTCIDLENFCGYSIGRFPDLRNPWKSTKKAPRNQGRALVRYRALARFNWDGTLREEYAPPEEIEKLLALGRDKC